jgi:sulfate transport system permease protein
VVLTLDHKAEEAAEVLGATAAQRLVRARARRAPAGERVRTGVLARRSVASRIVRIVADLPLAASPTVVGLLVVLAWSPNVGLLAPLVRATGIRNLFAWPGLVLVTIVVTLPYVVREVLPALYQLERAEEEAAAVLGATRWQTFWQVVFPAIRASVL